MRKLTQKAHFVALSGIIAALYALTTLVFAPISYGEIQIRISEALCVLPLFTPAAIPGLFVGCLVANLFSPAGIMWADLVFGSLATLISAICTHFIGKLPFKKAIYLAPFPAVVFNAIAMPLVIKFGYGSDFGLITIALSVLAGQFVSCYGIGIPFMLALKKIKNKIF